MQGSQPVSYLSLLPPELLTLILRYLDSERQKELQAHIGSVTAGIQGCRWLSCKVLLSIPILSLVVLPLGKYITPLAMACVFLAVVALFIGTVVLLLILEGYLDYKREQLEKAVAGAAA